MKVPKYKKPSPHQVQKLQAAIAAIHNHLHAGDINAAHEACECALDGQPISQRNLSLGDASNATSFAATFNQLAKEHDIIAAFVALLPSSSVPGATSVQIGGNVMACKFIEQAMGKTSTYVGEHNNE